MKRQPFLVRGLARAVFAGFAACMLASPVLAAPSDAALAARARQDTSSALVQLAGDPLATAARTRPERGRKIDFNSSSVRSYRAQLAGMRNDYKAWLRANVPQARVTGEFDIALNAVAVELNGASLGQVSATPLVKHAQYQGIYYPTGVDPDLSLISAPQAWAAGGGSANAGAGVKVAIVDSGIDVAHPCFDDAGYPPQAKLGSPALTNNKVIAAKVFNNRTPSLRHTPEAIDSHGTHVAGTVACNFATPATVNGAVIPYDISGVAPRALLGNYNVFPGDTGSARSEDILNALETAYADGFDVANMSLGGGASGIQDLLTIAVDNLDLANMVVAVAAGNSGPGLFTVESPGSAARALTAGASSVPHFVGTPVTSGGETVGAAAGDFETVAADLTAPLAVVTSGGSLGLACSALPAASLSGKIALVARGSCTFSEKIRNAQAAGAVAVLVANNVAGDPTAMGSDGTPSQPTAPAYMVSRGDGVALSDNDGFATTISPVLAYFLTANADIMAGFSSQGPTDVDFRVKPDVVAPGVNVLSSVPANACETPPCFAFFQGTSMAAPHLAGSAAFLRGVHPTWSAADIRSAVVNTADRWVLRSYSNATPVSTVNIVGSGRENLLSATYAAVLMSPVSVSFGAVPAGSGQMRTVDVTLHNPGLSPGTWILDTTSADASVSFSVSPGTVTVAPGGSATVTVTMVADRGATPGPRQGFLEVSQGGVGIAHAALYTLLR